MGRLKRETVAARLWLSSKQIEAERPVTEPNHKRKEGQGPGQEDLTYLMTMRRRRRRRRRRRYSSRQQQQSRQQQFGASSAIRSCFLLFFGGGAVCIL